MILDSATVANASTLRAIGWMVLSTVLFSTMHASIRQVSAAVHPFEIAFFRNLFGVLVVAPWLVPHLTATLRTARFPLHLARAATNTVAMLMFFTALTIAPLTDVTALAFTAPLFATVMAALFLHETVGIRRWAAILVGFVGAMVVLRPGFEAFSFGGALSLVAAVIWGSALFMIRMLGRTESSVTTTAYMSLLMTPMSFVPALFVWTWPGWPDLAWLLAIGLLGNAAQLCMTQSLKEADTAIVMPFDFLKLIWVSILGYWWFAEVPSAFTWLGGAIISASAVYIAWRERQLGKHRATPGPRASLEKPL